MSDKPKQCQRCTKEPAKAGERFCGTCKDEFRKEMRESGYLAKVPQDSGRYTRTEEMKENTQETKYGVPE